MTFLCKWASVSVLACTLENALFFFLEFSLLWKGEKPCVNYPKSLGCCDNYRVTQLLLNTGKEGNFLQCSLVASQVSCAGQHIWTLCKEYMLLPKV